MGFRQPVVLGEHPADDRDRQLRTAGLQREDREILQRREVARGIGEDLVVELLGFRKPPRLVLSDRRCEQRIRLGRLRKLLRHDPPRCLFTMLAIRAGRTAIVARAAAGPQE